jgi:hypothetical protein
MDAGRRPAQVYDITITQPADWNKLASQGLDLIVDPFVFRVGQFFLGIYIGYGRRA